MYEFRKIVGEFPEVPVYSKHDIEQMQIQINDAKKRGDTNIVRYEDRYETPTAVAFMLALKKQNHLNDVSYSSAARLYESVKHSRFYDHDTIVNRSN
jgi:hypothetical protein